MKARALAMAACDIGQREPAALLLGDLASSMAGRPPRWSIWPTRRQAVHRSDDKPVKGMDVSDADPTYAVLQQSLGCPLMPIPVVNMCLGNSARAEIAVGWRA
jgi:hypothetical protein